MSKERASLKLHGSAAVETFNAEVDKILAHPKQEPVAWCQLIDGKGQDLLTSFEMKDWINDDTWTPLYATPTKREPMTGSEISQGFRADKDANNAESYWAGVALAEKHYGVKK